MLKAKSNGCTLLPGKQTKIECFKCKQLEETCIPNVERHLKFVFSHKFLHRGLCYLNETLHATNAISETLTDLLHQLKHEASDVQVSLHPQLKLHGLISIFLIHLHGQLPRCFSILRGCDHGPVQR